MLIRTRVILITLGFGISIILGAAVELQLREDTAREQYVQSVVGDAMGTRVYSLAPNARGGTRFSMSEKIGGPLFPAPRGFL